VRIFVDSNIIIYLIEQPEGWGPRAAIRFRAIRDRGDEVVVSDLVRMECRIGPLRDADTKTLAHYDDFFRSEDVEVAPVTAAVCDQAATIRAKHGFRPLDALHLAAAVAHGCESFLTHDQHLGAYPDLAIEMLA